MVNIGGRELEKVSLLVSRRGINKLNGETISGGKWRKTTLPIHIGNQLGPSQYQDNYTNSNQEHLHSIQSQSSQEGSLGLRTPTSRSLSPVFLEYKEKRPGLRRQNTFVETSCQTTQCTVTVLDKEFQTENSQVHLQNQTETQTDLKQHTESSCQTEVLCLDEQSIQCIIEKTCSNIEVQTELSAESNDGKNFSELPDNHERCQPDILLTKTQPPKKHITNNVTQTNLPSLTNSEAQTVTEEKVDRKSPNQADRNSTFIKHNTLTDEIVFRVLLEHVEESFFDKESVKSDIMNALKVSSESDPGVNDCGRSPSFVSLDGVQRALSDTHYTAWNDGMKLQIDISRSVNYMDLSKLGNEGETPNSDEIWVNVEDDNKFLTSDTETYSVATDKISNVATFRGHVVGANAEMSHFMRSVSETELLELGNESLISDLDAQQFSGVQLATMIHHEMEPVKESLNSTGQTISGIADTLVNIQTGVDNLCCHVTQMKSKVLSNGEKENEMFDGDDNKIEIMKNGKLNGKSDELVDMIMLKLEKVLKIRDDQLDQAIHVLKSDNEHLRKELLESRNHDAQIQHNNSIEQQMNELLENMRKLKPNSPISSASSIEAKQRETRKKKRRSKSKSSSRMTKGLDYLTSSDEDLSEKTVKPISSLKMLAPNKVLVDTEQQTYESLNTHQECQTIDLTTADVSTLTDVLKDQDDAVIKKDQDGKRLSRSNRKEKLNKHDKIEEVTDSMTFLGQVHDADGETPSTDDAICNEEVISQDPKEVKKKSPSVKMPTKNKENEKTTSQAGKSQSLDRKKKDVKDKALQKSKSVERKPVVKEVKIKESLVEKNKSNDKKILRDKNNDKKAGDKKPEDKKEKKIRNDKDKSKQLSTNPSLSTTNATISKIIEGDDFKITITSNQELQSCELSDLENSSSPRKKIIVTPKMPDKKDIIKEEKHQEAKSKNGRIPVHKQYIKQKKGIPAPEQYPAARPPADQIPTPSLPSSSMSPAYPVYYDCPGYNHNLPPTPTQDYSICSNTYPISGRNTQMSMFEGEVITMLINQESRDSNVYDAPFGIPDFNEVRQSPDGAYSYAIEGTIPSSMSNLSDFKYDNEEECSDGMERDVIMEFVVMEESMKRHKFHPKRSSPFRGYVEKVKHRVIREFVHSERTANKRSKIKSNPADIPTKPASVRQKYRRKLWRTRAQSVSTEKLSKINSSIENAKEILQQSKRNCFSTDRLPMLSAAEEERIIRIKKYEDDSENLLESKRHYEMRKNNKQSKKCNKDVLIYEKGPLKYSENFSNNKESDSGIESQSSKENSSETMVIESSSESGVEVKNPRLEPIDNSVKRILSPEITPVTVECFIVSRGWQIDQAQLTNALAKLDGINFVRLQIANTMNRVLENIRPNNDVVLVHIGSQEIGEACHSISNEDSVAGNAFVTYKD